LQVSRRWRWSPLAAQVAAGSARVAARSARVAANVTARVAANVRTGGGKCPRRYSYYLHKECALILKKATFLKQLLFIKHHFIKTVIQ
jgi:hypothetical protein